MAVAAGNSGGNRGSGGGGRHNQPKRCNDSGENGGHDDSDGDGGGKGGSRCSGSSNDGGNGDGDCGSTALQNDCDNICLGIRNTQQSVLAIHYTSVLAIHQKCIGKHKSVVVLAKPKSVLANTKLYLYFGPRILAEEH